MLPYLGAIGLLTTSEMTVAASVLALAVYCVVMVLPALVLVRVAVRDSTVAATAELPASAIAVAGDSANKADSIALAPTTAVNRPKNDVLIVMLPRIYGSREQPARNERNVADEGG